MSVVDEATHEDVLEALKAHGPMLGKELSAAMPEVTQLKLWQTCFLSKVLQISHFARYYLRYDITRENIVRLSPSILRDFLSFTLISMPGQRDRVIDRHVELSNLHREISMRKIQIAREVVMKAFKPLSLDAQAKACAFIAGDLAFFLGHDEPREVDALGEMVRGSDIDIVVIHDGLTPEEEAKVGERMLAEKHYYLKHPEFRQELDFIVKDLDAIYGQFRFSDIRERIACKVVNESLFLNGSLDLYDQIKRRLEMSGVKSMLDRDFQLGLVERKTAMKELLIVDPRNLTPDTEQLFFFSQERVEFV